MRHWVSVPFAAFVSVLVACGAPPVAPPSGPEAHGHGGHGHHAGAPSGSLASGQSAEDEALEAVARTHGGAGPWAVLGYRMGKHALAVLGLQKGSFDLEVRHESPAEVQFSCVADGAQASTGASLGKLNLSHVVVPRADVKTVYRRKSTGQTLVLRPAQAFVARFENVPREHLAEAGREVIHLSDAELFETVK